MKHRILVAAFATVLPLALLPAGASASSLPQRYAVKLGVTNLAPLTGSFYEVWGVFGDKKLSGGGFNVDVGGRLVDGFGHRAVFTLPRDPADADAIVVTIEPLPDTDPGPSGIVVLAGTPRPKQGTAKLRFPVKFGTSAGSFILATPTDAVPTNETAGVWFLDPAAGPGPSLTLPTLPTGWVFEGWGVTQGKPLSTGRFTSVSGADGSAVFSGPIAGPPFPGEDFLNGLLAAGITPPVDLADGGSTIVLTVEPDLGGVDPTGAGPFSIKPLIGPVPAGSADHTSIPLGRDLSTMPSGTASF